jgi:hypothetical protein
MTKECLNAEGLTNYEASTPMHEGDAFGDFWKINRRSRSFELNLACNRLLLGMQAEGLAWKIPSVPPRTLGFINHNSQDHLHSFHRVTRAYVTKAIEWLPHRRSQATEASTYNRNEGLCDNDGAGYLVDVVGPAA